jgi:hypothetical protein
MSNDVILFCARCRAELRPGAGNFYHVIIQAVADPAPPEVSAEDLSGDLRGQIEALIAGMHDLSAQEAMDQVHRRFVLQLCARCYPSWIENPAGS